MRGRHPHFLLCYCYQYGRKYADLILQFWDDSGVRDNDGRKLDHTTLEVMRLRAVDAVEGGTHPEDVADALGMARGTVYGWVATYRDGGREALRARPVPGRPPKLTGAQLRRLHGLIVGVDPRQLEFPFAFVDPGDGPHPDPPRVHRPLDPRSPARAASGGAARPHSPIPTPDLRYIAA